MAGLKDLFIPRETAFFKHLETQVDLLSQATKLLQPFAKAYKKQAIEAAHKRMDKLVTEGDTLYLFIIQELHQTFITPIDRDEIQNLSFNLNRVLHSLRAVIDSLNIYHDRRTDKTLAAQIELLQKLIVSLAEMFRHPLLMKENQKCIAAIKDIEITADIVYRNALAELFKSRNAIQILKKKELFQVLENTIDKTEFVANLMQSILINHS